MEGLTRLERDIFACVGDSPMLGNTLAWAGINSGTGNLVGLAEMATRLSNAFSVLPGELSLVAPAAAEKVDIAGNVTAIDHGRHLHLRVRPDAPVQMLFTGHMDTVYPADHPFQAVTRRDDGTINGPGVADMKGGLALLLAALEAVEASGGAADLGYEVVINSDEETGSFSSAALLARAARGKVAALTYEPALPDGTLAGARGGTGNFSVVVRGRSAHAGRNPEEGRNAVLAASDIALRLAAIGGPTLSVNPARIDGGGPNNVVPDLAVLRVNFRPKAAEEIARAGREIAAIAAAVAAERDGSRRGPRRLQPAAQADRCGRREALRSRSRDRRRPRPRDRLARYRRRVRRQQHRRRWSAGGRHDGRARRRDPFAGRVSDRRQPRRTRGAVGADDPQDRGKGGIVSFVVRAARDEDLEHLYEMAKLTGGGFTNLPPDRKALTAKLDRSHAAFARPDGEIEDELFVLILENTATGEVRGTCQVFTLVGQRHPFYSYRIGTLTQASKELGRTFRAEMLSLTTDLEGCSEVGGLFLHPGERAGGLGMLLARSRYLFIKAHRARFADRILAELRGVIDEAGGSPFWDGLAGRFFGMNFQDADQFNAVNGHQFIADLMPKHPIYTAMLTETARAAIGLPHPSGRAAMRMLENEGFAFESYVDIFDGGPTMTAKTDKVRTIERARGARVLAVDHDGGEQALVATGQLVDWRCAYAAVRRVGEDGVVISPDGAMALGVGEDASVLHIPRV